MVLRTVDTTGGVNGSCGTGEETGFVGQSLGKNGSPVSGQRRLLSQS